MTDRNRSWAQEAAATCLQHVVGDDGKNCRNCGKSAAWIAERNRKHGSTYEVPGSHPRVVSAAKHGTRWWKTVALIGQKSPPLGSDEWIEVVW